MRKILSALILAASLPAFADPVTLMSASTATGPSTAVHSTHIGTAGGTDVWTFNLSAFSRRAQLQESLDGVNWSLSFSRVSGRSNHAPHAPHGDRRRNGRERGGHRVVKPVGEGFSARRPRGRSPERAPRRISRRLLFTDPRKELDIMSFTPKYLAKAARLRTATVAPAPTPAPPPVKAVATGTDRRSGGSGGCSPRGNSCISSRTGYARAVSR
jgi:hypothetical protein